MSRNLATVQAAVVDGRARTVFYRQTQLEKLHAELQKKSSSVQDAIRRDTGVTNAEAAVEVYAVLQSVANAYHSLQPKDSLLQEYSVANGRNAADSVDPIGLAYIEPTRHTRVFSTISAVSSALAAGNCVVVLLEQSIREVHNVLRQIFADALENDSFAITDRSAFDSLPAASTLFVLQESEDKFPRSNQLVSLSSAPVVAFVDRSADLRIAARELVAARLMFGGSSPYAPDLILVNEFVKEDFLQAVVQECQGYSVGYHSTDGFKASDALSSTPSRTQPSIDSLRKQDPQLRVIVQADKYGVVEANSRTPLLLRRTNAPIISVFPMRSLDDGLAITDRNSTVAYTAAYHFGNPATAKYLSQFVPATVSFVNHVPREVLLGPAGPLGHRICLTHRYRPSMFIVPRPQFIVPSKQSEKLADALPAGDLKANRFFTEAMAPLAIMVRSSGKGIGFFEQGFLLNAGFILAGLLSVTALGTFTLYYKVKGSNFVL